MVSVTGFQTLYGVSFCCSGSLYKLLLKVFHTTGYVFSVGGNPDLTTVKDTAGSISDFSYLKIILPFLSQN